MSTMVWLIQFLFLLFLGSFCQSCDLIVDTKYGKVEGIVKTTRNNRPYLSFTGIPFAKPPVGDLRFATPQKPDPWKCVLNATVSSPRCIQRNYLFYVVPPIEGKEDCLYLNVYVPQKKHAGNKKNKLPVLVSIPWGGFLVEGGDEGYFGPSYFLDYDVILVSFNYRVGPFGFLSTLDDEAPGNVAFKDQVLALQWVQDNIEYFGGMKEDVTIMGQSAGAGSTHLHMISPSSRGLFTKVISESGNAIASWATPDNDKQKSVVPTQARLVNCGDSIGDSKKLIRCLRKVPAEDIMWSQDAFKLFFQFPYTVYPPVTENRTKLNPNPFLTKSPLEYVKAEEYQKVPWLTGVVKNEGLLPVSGLLGPEQERQALNSSFSDILHGLLALSTVTNDAEGLYHNLSQAYLGGQNYINDNDEWEQGFINLWSDRMFVVSLYQAVALQVPQGHDSIYFYSFEYSGEYTFAGLWSNGSGLYNPNWTVSHCDELLYLFRSPDLFEEQLTSKSDQELSSIMLRLWINFAIYGDPNPTKNLVLKDVKWKPLRPNKFNVLTYDDIELLNITGTYKRGADFKITRGFYKERISLWINH